MNPIEEALAYLGPRWVRIITIAAILASGVASGLAIALIIGWLS